MTNRGLFLCLLFCIPCSYAQMESLTIGPGDLLHVAVLEAPNLEQHSRVSDKGDLPLILGGNINLSGTTPYEASQRIHSRLVEGHYLLDPHVTVTVEHFATTNVTVNGQVKSPGSYEIDTPRSMTDVLALAGGLMDSADRTVTIRRRDGLQLTEQFESNDGRTTLRHDILINPGDTVYVSRALQVYLLGNFAHPGAYSASPNSARLTVLQAVAYAGGTPPTAVPSKARLIRKGEDGRYIEIPLPLSDMQKGKKQDQLLQADDIIYLPFSYLRNMAVGVDSLVAAAASASIYRF